MYANTYILSLWAVYLKCIKYCHLEHVWLLTRNNSGKCCYYITHKGALLARWVFSQCPQTLTWGELQSKNTNSGWRQCPLKWPERFHEGPKETFILAMMSESGKRRGPLCDPHHHNPASLWNASLSDSAIRYLHLCNKKKNKTRDRRCQDESE